MLRFWNAKESCSQACCLLQAGNSEVRVEAQQQIEEENRALQAELQDLGQQVWETEKSMSEISALSQMFSQQVSLQSEQTLQLYNQVRLWVTSSLKLPRGCERYTPLSGSFPCSKTKEGKGSHNEMMCSLASLLI